MWTTIFVYNSLYKLVYNLTYKQFIHSSQNSIIYYLSTKESTGETYAVSHETEISNPWLIQEQDKKIDLRETWCGINILVFKIKFFFAQKIFSAVRLLLAPKATVLWVGKWLILIKYLKLNI